jgi:deazaflavin-dependent oxidoreductase (nitroreductase family)
LDPARARKIAHFNKRFTNRVMRPLAPYLPGFGLVVHTGRTSGRTYQTPVNVFTHDDSFVIALTYGTQSDWVRNVQAAGGCDLITQRRRYGLSDPEIVHDEHRRLASAKTRPILRKLGVADFLRLRRAD